MGERMRLEEILIDENSVIRSAVERLETVRCKVIYAVDTGKLVASISDGDVRRYVLQGGDTSLPIRCIANYNPTFLVQYEKERLDKIFSRSEIYSVPIVNYNHEVVEIVFRNGQRVRKVYNLSCPVVMMAGGKGTRLFPYTKILPKALIPIGEIPIAERIINNFVDFGCRNFFMVVNHKKDMIRAYFDSIKKDYDLFYIIEEKPLGTGGGLYLLNGKITQDFFLVNCDVIVDADFNEIYSYHKKEHNFVTIVAAIYHYTVPYGVINCDKKMNYLGISEKPEWNYLISTGVYVVDSNLLACMPQETEVQFPDFIEKMKKQDKKIGVYVVEESAYMDMGQIEEMEKMREKLKV